MDKTSVVEMLKRPPRGMFGAFTPTWTKTLYLLERGSSIHIAEWQHDEGMAHLSFGSKEFGSTIISTKDFVWPKKLYIDTSDFLGQKTYTISERESC